MPRRKQPNPQRFVPPRQAGGGVRRARGPRRRCWVFTLNNPVQWEPFLELPEGVSYMVWQVERGDRLGTIHLQGYIELHRDQYVSWLKTNVFEKAHFEVRRGTQDQAIDYCKKAEGRQAGPYELGTKGAAQQGQRTDIVLFRDAILEGNKLPQLWDKFPREMARYPRMYRGLRNSIRPMRGAPVIVTLIYGQTGTGKTRYVYDNWEESDQFWRWAVPNTACWFDGYDQHELVLLDDFAGKKSKMSLVMLLQVLDRYPVPVPVKGDFVWWCPKQIAITSNIHPKNWYDYTGRIGQYAAIKRRIRRVIDLTIKSEDGEPIEMGNEWWYDPVLYPRPERINLGDAEDADDIDLEEVFLRHEELYGQTAVYGQHLHPPIVDEVHTLDECWCGTSHDIIEQVVDKMFENAQSS